jgi:hypothetical protein
VMLTPSYELHLKGAPPLSDESEFAVGLTVLLLKTSVLWSW